MELLAPARDITCLAAAIQNGADAVYVGGRAFSARAAANAFDDDMLARAADYVHVRGAKLHLAVNTLVKDTEFSDLCRMAERAYAIGVDAFIVQDAGVAALLHQSLPGLPLHASTQMTLHDLHGVHTAQRMGFSRVVLARETTAQQLRTIRAQTACELEVFVHGALCMCYSGQCLMSSMIGGRSGNRGACAQPCRLPYSLQCDGRTVARGPLLSPRDLCLVRHVQELAAMGIDSLKIEGRLKSPEYVGMAARVYRAALNGEANEADVADMLAFYSRGGSCRGYWDGPQFADMMMHDKPGAKVTAQRALERDVQASFAQGAETAPTPVELTARLHIGQPASLMLSARGHTVTVTGAVCEPAQNQPIPQGRVEQQLCKLGGTPFAAHTAQIEMDDGLFVSVRDINELRRAGCAALEAAIADASRREPCTCSLVPPQLYTPDGTPQLAAYVTTREQYDAAAEAGVARIYAPVELCGQVDEAGEVIYVLPPIVKDATRYRALLDGKRRILADNLGVLDAFSDCELYGGMRLNAFNSQSVAALARLGIREQMLSPELNLRELTQIVPSIPCSVTVYGHLPLMLCENCIVRSAAGCGACKQSPVLVDRMGERFPILSHDCRSVVLNAKPLYMADKLADLLNLKINYINLYFTVENREICGKIIKEYKRAIVGETVQPPHSFTRGHFYRGVQ